MSMIKYTLFITLMVASVSLMIGCGGDATSKNNGGAGEQSPPVGEQSPPVGEQSPPVGEQSPPVGGQSQEDIARAAKTKALRAACTAPQDAIPISDRDGLEAIGDNDENLLKSYKLTDDIDLAGENWKPISIDSINSIQAGFIGKPFKGDFYGCGFTITNLKIDRPSDKYIGIFSEIEGESLSKRAIIKDLTIEVNTIQGSWHVGALAGALDRVDVQNVHIKGGQIAGQAIKHAGGLAGNALSSIIANSSSTSSVTGALYVGGLVGNTDGHISNSYATGNVIGTAYVGGLVGGTDGQISNSYATGNVTLSAGNQAHTPIGGLVGEISDKPTSNSYATGNVTISTGATVTGAIGGLVGEVSDKAPITNSYFNTEPTGQAYSGVGAGSQMGVIGITEAQITAMTFTNATWNDTIWTFLAETWPTLTNNQPSTQ